jgi:hypothetical protein
MQKASRKYFVFDTLRNIFREIHIQRESLHKNNLDNNFQKVQPVTGRFLCASFCYKRSFRKKFCGLFLFRKKFSVLRKVLIFAEKCFLSQTFFDFEIFAKKCPNNLKFLYRAKVHCKNRRNFHIWAIFFSQIRKRKSNQMIPPQQQKIAVLELKFWAQQASPPPPPPPHPSLSTLFALRDGIAAREYCIVQLIPAQRNILLTKFWVNCTCISLLYSKNTVLWDKSIFLKDAVLRPVPGTGNRYRYH